MARYRFDQLFVHDSRNNTLTPRVRIKMGPIILSPGMTFNNTVVFAGVNFFDIIGYDIEVELTIGDIYEIRGVYQ